jgi:hypothetical protein
MNGLMSEDEYIVSLPASKQSVYRLGKVRWAETQKISIRLELRQKSNESHYDHPTKIRGRCFFNPGPEFKLITGCYNKNVLTAVKHFLPEFVHGMNCGDLEADLTKMYQSVSDPCFGDADGSSHDAHEAAWKIEAVDHLMHKLLLGEYSARMGYDDVKAQALYGALTAIAYPFFAYYVGTRNLMIIGELLGSVFSGASTLTTLGNTLRSIIMQILVKRLAGLRDHQCAFRQAGDDQLQCVSWDKRKVYERAGRLIYVQKEAFGGIGYLVKTQNWGGSILSFLSKTGGAAADQVTAHRQWHRTLIGGNYTRKLKKAFRAPHHRWAINSQLASWIGDLPIFSGYLAERMKMPTAIPKSRDILWNDPESFWKSLTHDNPHSGPGHHEHLAPFLYRSAYSAFPEYANTPGFYDHLPNIRYE